LKSDFGSADWEEEEDADVLWVKRGAQKEPGEVASCCVAPDEVEWKRNEEDADREGEEDGEAEDG
jgi:hypothetical protein